MVNRHLLRNVLQFPPAQIGGMEIQFVLNHLKNRLRNTDLPRRSQSLQPRGNVHPSALDLSLAKENITQMYPDSEIDRSPLGHVYVDDRAPWWEISDTDPQFGGESGMEPKAPESFR